MPGFFGKPLVKVTVAALLVAAVAYVVYQLVAKASGTPIRVVGGSIEFRSDHDWTPVDCKDSSNNSMQCWETTLDYLPICVEANGTVQDPTYTWSCNSTGLTTSPSAPQPSPWTLALATANDTTPVAELCSVSPPVSSNQQNACDPNNGKQVTLGSESYARVIVVGLTNLPFVLGDNNKTICYAERCHLPHNPAKSPANVKLFVNNTAYTGGCDDKKHGAEKGHCELDFNKP